MVAGLEVPTSGSIRLSSEDISQSPPQSRDVGFVFQFYALYPHLSVFDNIAFPLQSTGNTPEQVRRRVQEMVESLGLQDLVRRRPSQLSGGDHQRVALARALVRSPRLWLMDEPLGTLDGELRLEMRELIRTKQIELGITTIYVTHDQEEAMSLADRIVVMQGGRIRQAGAPAQVYGDPEDLFVADFVGSPGMNFVAGESMDGDVLRAPGGVFLPLPSGTSRTRALTLGARPESVLPDSGGPLTGTVVLDELLGAHRMVHLDTPAGRFIMRRPTTETYAAGTKLRLALAPDQVRLFDTESGERLR
jgi:multiple sugar transport system ATP-binding protein